MADLIHGNTELGATKDDLLLAVVKRELESNVSATGMATDVSNFAVEGIDSISFPKLGSFSVANRTEGAAGDASVVTSTVETMDLDFNAYIAWIVDAKTRKQNKINVEAALAGRAAAAHGRYLSQQIIDAAAAAAGLSVNGGVPADITQSNVLDMIEYVESNEGILEQAIFRAHPDQRKALLALPEFSSANVYGQPVNFTGQLGFLYGIPLVIDTKVGSQQCLLVDKEAIAFGMQSSPAMGEQDANEYGVGAKRAAMDMLFGVKAMRLEEKGAAAGTSPLIAKLRD